MGTSGSILPTMVTTSQKAYATGHKAKAQCPICGDVIRYLGMVTDWRGVRVCPDCNDPRHPQENVHIFADPEALQHPSPLLDTESTAGLVRAGPRAVATMFLRQVTVTVV